MTALDANLDVDGEDTVIRLRGELDIAAVADVKALVTAAVTRSAMRTLILNMSEVGFLDSCGIGALLSAQRVCAEHGAALRLQAVPPQMWKVLAITGLIEVFGVDEDDRAPKETRWES